MNVASVLLSIVFVLLDTYLVHAENLLFPPLPEGECGVPQPNGLTDVVNHFSESFPTYDFLSIFLEAVNEDEEVVNVLSMLFTDEFNVLLNKINDIDEWVEITDIFCDDLQFNINFYLKVLAELFKAIPLDPSSTKSKTRSRPGVTGLLNDVIDILPLEEWEPEFDKLVESNESVQIAVDTVKGDLFQAVVDTIYQMDEFSIMSQHLKHLGVPVDCGIAHMRRLLKWSFDKCACGISTMTTSQC